MSSPGGAALPTTFVRVVKAASRCCSSVRLDGPTPLVRVGDEKLLGGEERDHPTTHIGRHHLLLDPRRSMTIARPAIGLQLEGHPLLYLHRLVGPCAHPDHPS